MLRNALSTTLATLPEQFHTARSELIELLRQDGILYRSPTQPVLSRDGTSARWMLDSLAVTLSSRGGELAGRCVLELLKRFDGRQIATYGLTAVPVLQACVLQSAGRYQGLLVRKERKEHGSRKLIEGRINPDEPVILIDDSVSSGTSMEEACQRLEQAGLRVEGGICLVRFGWYGGYAQMQGRGYHMEAVYDIWDDFIYHMEDEDKPLLNPSKWFPEFQWSPHRAPYGMHPAQLARIVMSEYLSSGKLLRSPARLDRDYDSSGGAWVSVRSLRDIHVRHSRDGFWHFPGETYQSAAEDVVLASLRTVAELPPGQEGLKAIDESGIAVTFFTALETCEVGDLDNERYGIVVRSLERRSLMGGALPRMPGIGNEWEQFQHARMKNGRLVSFEPYEILRHEVVKAVEPNISWQPTGVPAGEKLPWQQNETICGQIVERARDIVLARLFSVPEATSPLPADVIPEAIDSIYVTVYINGQLRGCMGAVTHQLDEDLRSLALAALADVRFAEHVPIEASSVAVTVSLLFNPLELGELLPEEVVPYYRHGQQTLMVYRGALVGMLLPFVAVSHNLDRWDFPRAVVEKAGLTEPPYYWCRFDCATWLGDARGTSPLVGGFRSEKNHAASPEESFTSYASLHARYLIRHQQADGQLYSSYEPFQNRLYEGIDLPRLAHGAWVLARGYRVLADDNLKTAADAAIKYLLNTACESEAGFWLETSDEIPSVSEISFLLLALSCLPDGDPRRSMINRLAATLWSCIELPHGRISTHRQASASTDAFQDYFPGQALLALAAAAEQTPSSLDEERLHRSFLYYRHRFRYQRHFGQVSWLMQAFSKWWQITREAPFAELVLEIGDWILEYQQVKTGAFVNDHQPETPGYTTAVYLEGIGAALHLAVALDDKARARKYSESFAHGFGFLDQLIIQERDESLLPNPELALGGLRQGVYCSLVRTDFVQHSLSAILQFLDN